MLSIHTIPEAPSSRSTAPTPVVRRKVLIALSLMVIGRLWIQATLYELGFVALTADEFGRTIVAAVWAQQPTIIWSGFWLPLHTYLVGGVVLLGVDWWNGARLITTVLGLGSIVLMYQIGRQTLQDYRVALLGAGLLALNPLHIWLTAVPLTEISVFTALLAFLVGFLRYLHQRRSRDLWMSVAALLIANALRYEAWMWSLLFSCAVVVHLLRSDQVGRQQWVELLFAGLIPWIVPVLWIVGNAWQTGDPFYFYTFTRTYERTWYGATRDLAGYLVILGRSDPFLIVFSTVGFAFLCLSPRQSDVIRWYLIVTSVPIILFVAIQGGLRVPEGQMYRRIALFIWQLYPLMAYSLERSIQWLVRRRQWLEQWVIALCMIGIGIVQLGTAFAFSNDPAARGLAVGRQLAVARQSLLNRDNDLILVERVYWEYLAIQVGANDVTHLVFDRPADLARMSTSWLLLGGLSQ